jgi:hypothetical protein
MTPKTLKEQLQRFPILPEKTKQSHKFPIEQPQIKPDKHLESK